MRGARAPGQAQSVPPAGPSPLAREWDPGHRAHAAPPARGTRAGCDHTRASQVTQAAHGQQRRVHAGGAGCRDPQHRCSPPGGAHSRSSRRPIPSRPSGVPRRCGQLVAEAEEGSILWRLRVTPESRSCSGSYLLGGAGGNQKTPGDPGPAGEADGKRQELLSAGLGRSGQAPWRRLLVKLTAVGRLAAAGEWPLRRALARASFLPPWATLGQNPVCRVLVSFLQCPQPRWAG